MTPDEKRDALAIACRNTPGYDCGGAFRGDGSCPVCGVCTSFANTSDKEICELYAEAVKRGAIKEEKKMSMDIEKAIKEIKQIQTWHTNEELKLAIQLQRNEILKEELSAIYSILDDIRYNRIN